MSCDDNTLRVLNPNELIRRTLSEKLLKECREAFDLLDYDRVGVIATKELVSALRSLGYNPSTVVLDKIREIDIESKTGAGEVNFDGFINLVCYQIRFLFTSEDMLKDFKAIDLNDDGKITKQELRNYLESLGMPFSIEEIDGIVEQADLNNDGTIDYMEFIIMMCPEK